MRNVSFGAHYLPMPTLPPRLARRVEDELALHGVPLGDNLREETRLLVLRGTTDRPRDSVTLMLLPPKSSDPDSQNSILRRKIKLDKGFLPGLKQFAADFKSKVLGLQD